MKIIKSKSMIFLLVFLFVFTAVFPIFKKTRLYTFVDKNKNDKYKLIHNIEGKFLLSSNDSFERIEILEKSILHKAFKGELGTQNSSDESALNLLKSLL